MRLIAITNAAIISATAQRFVIIAFLSFTGLIFDLSISASDEKS